MLSTPPAMIRSASPALTARAAVMMASSPEPQSRLMIPPPAARGKQCRHPRHIAVVLTDLIGAAEQDIINRFSSNSRILLTTSAVGGSVSCT